MDASLGTEEVADVDGGIVVHPGDAEVVTESPLNESEAGPTTAGIGLCSDAPIMLEGLIVSGDGLECDTGTCTWIDPQIASAPDDTFWLTATVYNDEADSNVRGFILQHVGNDGSVLSSNIVRFDIAGRDGQVSYSGDLTVNDDGEVGVVVRRNFEADEEAANEYLLEVLRYDETGTAIGSPVLIEDTASDYILDIASTADGSLLVLQRHHLVTVSPTGSVTSVEISTESVGFFEGWITPYGFAGVEMRMGQIASQDTHWAAVVELSGGRAWEEEVDYVSNQLTSALLADGSSLWLTGNSEIVATTRDSGGQASEPRLVAGVAPAASALHFRQAAPLVGSDGSLYIAGQVGADGDAYPSIHKLDAAQTTCQTYAFGEDNIGVEALSVSSNGKVLAAHGQWVTLVTLP